MGTGNRGRYGRFLRISLRPLRWIFLFFLATALLTYAQGKKSSKPVDLNTATAEQLDKLPEVGPKLAKAIVEFREKSGPFQRVEDLLAVPGISKRRLEKIRPHVYVEPPKRESGSAPPGAG